MLDFNPINAGRLDDYADRSASTLRDMLRKTYVYVEGPSDSRFYKGLMFGSSSLHFVDGRWGTGKNGMQKMGGCDFVLQAWGEYCGGGHTRETANEKKVEVQDCIFCIDRDFRGVLGIPPEDDFTETLFYQLCTGKYGDGFNDLECVLVSLPMYEYALATKYKVPMEKAREMLDHAIDVAAVLGCYRMGNRIAKGDDGSNVFWQDNLDDYVDTDGRGRRKEMGVFHLFRCGAAVVRNGLVELDETKLQRSLDFMGATQEKIEFALSKTREFKARMETGNKLDYCRGHDITYLLCMGLRDYLKDLSLTVNKVEDSLAMLITQQAVAQNCRQILAEYEFVKKLEELAN